MHHNRGTLGAQGIVFFFYQQNIITASAAELVLPSEHHASLELPQYPAPVVHSGDLYVMAWQFSWKFFLFRKEKQVIKEKSKKNY